MTGDLSVLIRVQKHALDQKQKFLAELYQQAETYKAQKQSMLDALAVERENIADMDVEMQAYFAPYAQNVDARCKEIDHALAALDKRIDAAREEIRLAFGEVKKLEMIDEERAREAQKAIDRKESTELDEIGLEVFRRGQAEE